MDLGRQTRVSAVSSLSQRKKLRHFERSSPIRLRSPEKGPASILALPSCFAMGPAVMVCHNSKTGAQTTTTARIASKSRGVQAFSDVFRRSLPKWQVSTLAGGQVGVRSLSRHSAVFLNRSRRASLAMLWGRSGASAANMAGKGASCGELKKTTIRVPAIQQDETPAALFVSSVKQFSRPPSRRKALRLAPTPFWLRPLANRVDNRTCGGCGGP